MSIPMIMFIKNIPIDNPALATVTFQPNLKSGRRFDVGIRNNGTTTTMKDLYKEANSFYETNKEDRIALQNLKVFVQTVSQAENDANAHYAHAKCSYHFYTFFRRLFGGAFLGSHSKRLQTLSNKIDRKLGETQIPTPPVDHIPSVDHIPPVDHTPTAPVQVTGKWDDSTKFTDKVYEPLPTPKKFEGSLISKHEFEALLQKHQTILDQEGPGTHGYATPNLRLAFDKGNGSTTVGGEAPFFQDKTLNKDFHLKFQQVMTLISKEKPSVQEDWMRVLSMAFRGCNAGRVDTTQQISDNLLNNSADPDFETRVKIKINGHKRDLFNQLIREMAPLQTDWMPIHHQIPHLTSGYLAVVGSEIGLNGVEEAKTDQHKYNVLYQDGKLLDKNAFIREFNTRLANKIDEIANDIAGEINDPNGPFHPTGQKPSFGSWFAAQVNKGFLNPEFAYHDDSKQYPGIKEPSEDQKDNLVCYISNIEVRHILGMLGYLK